LAFRAFGRLLIVVFSLMTASCMTRPDLPAERIIADAHVAGSRVALDHRGRRLASAGLDGRLVLWDVASGRRLGGWKAHDSTVHGLAFYGADRLVSAGWDGRVVIWDLQGRVVAERATDRPITAMAFRARPFELWTGHDDGSLRRWDRTLDLKVLLRLPEERRVTALALDRERLAAADSGGAVWLVEAEEMARLARLPTHLRTLVFDDRGRLYGGTWFKLYRWDLETGAQQAFATDHFGIIKDLVWDSSRRLLLSISRQTDSTVLALDPNNGATLTRFGRHELCGADVALSGDGRHMATTADDGSVRLWLLPERLP